MMRGRIWCHRHGGVAIIRRLRNDLVGLPVEEPRVWTKGFFGASAPFAELVARQFVIERLGGVLTRALFAYLGGAGTIGVGMPGPWRDYLRSEGWKVSGFASSLSWHAMTLARWGHGILSTFRLCMVLWRASPADNLPQLGPHVVFDALGPSSLPHTNSALTSYDICSFYARWSGRLAGVKAICHGISGIDERRADDLPVLYRPPAWELAGGRSNALRLMWWGVRAGVVSAIQMLSGRWHYAFLLAEAARAYAARLCPPDVLANEYLFHASGAIYRPMWTYEVERRGAGVSLYFYSAFDQPKLSRGYEAQNFEWGPANWPRYIVWDSYQEAVLRRDLGDDIDVVQAGTVTFSDSGKPVPALPDLPVAIFDIQPHRLSVHFGITTMNDCLAEWPGYYFTFLREANEVVRECGGNVVLKPKRHIGERSDKRYKRLFDEIAGESGVCLIDPGISAMRVSKVCVAGISAPFTSTAMYLRECGIPSVYYDPMGWMQRDDDAAHGIPILQGKAELRAWLKGVLADRDRPVAGKREASC